MQVLFTKACLSMHATDTKFLTLVNQGHGQYAKEMLISR